MTDNIERALQERLLARSQVSPRDVEALRLFVRTLPAQRSRWSRPIFGWALAGAAVALAAAVALPQLLGVIPGPGATPSPSAPAPTQPVETPMPSEPAPTPGSTDGFPLPYDGDPMELSLRDFDSLVSAGIGTRGETMTNRWFEFDLEQLAPNAIRVTWSAYPDEPIVRVEVSEGLAGELVIKVIQRAPPPLSDAEGQDRSLYLVLDRTVDPSTVKVGFEEPA